MNRVFLSGSIQLMLLISPYSGSLACVQARFPRTLRSRARPTLANVSKDLNASVRITSSGEIKRPMHKDVSSLSLGQYIAIPNL